MPRTIKHTLISNEMFDFVQWNGGSVLILGGVFEMDAMLKMDEYGDGRGVG